MDNGDEPLEIEKDILLDEESPLKRIDLKTREITNINELEGYIYSCGQALALVSTSVDKARLSIELLECSYDLSPKGTKYTAAEFIEFAIENYFLRSAAIYDRCLIFMNKLLNLGISNESIGHELIITNEHIKKYNLAEKLKSVRKKCTEYRVERNHIVHHGRYNGNENFYGMTAIHKANSLQLAMGVKSSFDQALIDEITREIIETQVSEFKSHLKSINSAVKALYEVALPVYHLKKSEIKKTML